MVIDVAVVGAGLSGLVCVQRLRQAGYRVVLIEKSRGLGGRMATRRLANTCVDHGVSYLENQGDYTQQLIEALLPQKLIQPWTEFYELNPNGWLQPAADRPACYVAPPGMTTIAKFLATGLEIQHNQRVTAISAAPTAWTLTLESADGLSEIKLSEIEARAIVLAIPAPQALALVEPLAGLGIAAEFLASLRSVQFDPCLTAIAVYPTDSCALATTPWDAVTFSKGAVAWVGRDSSKRETLQPLFVVRSSASFAQQHLETASLQTAQALVQAAETLLPQSDAVELQIHRWRYAFVRHPFAQLHLTTATPLLLSCCGDWCGGSQVEAALQSGVAAGDRVNVGLDDRPLPDLNLAKLILQI